MELFEGISRRSLLGAASSAALSAGLTSSAFAQAGAAGRPAERDSLRQARAAVAAERERILKISREVWAKPAIGLREQAAMEVHIKALEAAGFKIVSRNSGGHPTAFVAEWARGNGGPKVGFLPEYDALPGLGNQAVAEKKPTADGVTDGHGCGHNMLGAACTGAGIALKAMMEARGLNGTVRVYGCGAEETQGAKVYMARAGLFEDLDAALAWHPHTEAGAGLLQTAANRGIKFKFKGKSAHAGIAPWQGRSALDGAELLTHAINLMREHREPTARLHYIYEMGGLAPNVVPDEATVYMKARDATTPLLEETMAWLKDAAKGAALAAQVQCEVQVFIGVAELIPNEPLARRIYEHLVNTPLNWTEDEQEFAKKLQRAANLKETGMATKPLPFIPLMTAGGSTDCADISWNTPTGLFAWPSVSREMAFHTWQVTAAGGMSIGDKATIQAAEILTATGLDVMTDAELRARAKADLQKRTDGRKYVCALDPNQKEPVDLPDFLRKDGRDELTQGLPTEG
ncbi:MAG: amidohydrolase [Fimbriimonadaceae bacterium]|nr:amidohydrolase [Fimbriimonadaceae bacterium]